MHARYPDRGCALAIELKKTFMDEWTGEVDDDRLARLEAALCGTVPGLVEAARAAHAAAQTDATSGARR